MIIYDISYRTGVNIERDTLQRIVQHPMIVAVKDCSSDIEKTTALIADGNAQVLAGEDIQIFNSLYLGGSGAISASAHIRADLYVHMQACIENGQLEAARHVFSRLLPWMQTVFLEPNPGPVKAALSIQGLIEAELRMPMHPCSEPTLKRISDVLAELTN